MANSSPNWFDRWFKKSKPATLRNPGRRAPQLGFEYLEDRSVPATIITIQEAAGTLDGLLTATNGTINATDFTGVVGSISRAKLQAVSATTPVSITAQQSIVFDTGLTAPVALAQTAGVNAQFIALNGDITLPAAKTLSTAGGALSVLATGGTATLSVGNLTTGGSGSINLQGDVVAIDPTSSINAGAGTGIVTIAPSTNTRPISLGTEVGTSVSLTDAELDRITASILRIGSNNAGPISVNAAISPALTPTLSLITGDTTATAVTQTGAIVVTKLAVQSVGTVALGSATNAVSSIAANVTGSAPNTFTFLNSNGTGLAIDTVDGVAGITVSNGNAADRITINSADPLTQTAGANVTGPQLELTGAGPVTLTNVGNNVALLAANLTPTSGNALSYTDADSFTVSTVNATTGVTTTNGTVTLTTVNGNIIVAQNVAAGTAAVNLTAGGANNIIQTQNVATITGSSATLTADRMDIATGTSVNVGAGATNIVTLRPNTAGQLIGLDDTAGDPNGTLRLSNAEIGRVTAGVLRIGRNDASAAGNISVASAITPTAATLHLITGAAILDANSTGADLTVTSLALEAVTGIASGTVLELAVTTVAAKNNTSGSIQLAQTTGDLIVGTVDGVVGVNNAATSGFDAAGTVVRADAGNLTINSLVTTAGDKITLTAVGGAVTTTAAVTVTAGNGNIALNATTDISVGAAVSTVGTGTITAAADSDTSGAGDFTSTGTLATVGGAITASGVNVTVGGTVTSTGGGAIVLDATVGTGANLAVNAAVATSGGNGSVTLRADNNISVTAAVSAVGTGTITATADFDTSGVGTFTSTAPGTLTTATGNITIAGATAVTIAGPVSTTGANVSATVTQANGTLSVNGTISAPSTTSPNGVVSFAADNMTIGANVTAGRQVNIVPVNGPRAVDLGTETAGSLSLTDTELDFLLTPVINLGNATPVSTITVTAPITLANVVTTVFLTAGSDVTESGAGSFIMANAASLLQFFVTGGLVNFSAVTNDVAKVSGALFNATSPFTYVDANTVEVTGITTTNGPISVTSVAGAVNVTGNITTGTGTAAISIDAGAGFSLAAATTIQSGDAAAGGPITIRSNVGTTTGTADIVLNATSSILTRGDITLDAKPAGVGANFGGGITLAPTAVLAGPGGTLANSITLNAGKDVTVSALSATTTISVTTTKNIFDDTNETTALSANQITLSSGGVIGGQNIITPANVLAQTAAPGTTPFTGAIDFDLTGVTPTLTVVQSAPGNVQLRKVGSTGLTRSTLVLTGANVGATNQLALISSAGNLALDALLNTPQNIDTLLATTGGSSIVFSGSGQVNNVTSGSTTNLVATGSAAAAIVDNLSGDNTPEVTSTNGVLITTGGAIGTSVAPLEFNFGLLNGFTNGNAAATGGAAFLTDTANGLSVGQFSAAGTTTTGNVTLASRGNNGGTGLNLTAVTSNDNIAEIIGNVVTLDTSAAPTNGATGQIGSFSGTAQFFEVNATVLNASTNNSRLWISEVGTGATAGAQIGLVTAGTDTAILRVRNGGNLTSEASDAGVADVVGASVILSAPEGGNFGSAGSALEIDATTGLTATVTGTGLINITDTTGGLPAATATTGTGDITLASLGGAMTVTSATPTVSGTIFLRAVGGLLTVTNAVTPIGDIVLQTTTSGSINIAKATTASGSLSANSAADITFTGTVGPVASATTTATLAAIGAIVGSTTVGVTDLQASSLSAGAGTGIGSSADPLATGVSTLAASSGTGGVFISNTAATTTVGMAGALTGVTAVTSGDISITGSAALTVSNVVTATSGNVTLTAPGATNVNAAVSGANITATGGTTLTTTAAVTGTGTVDLTASAGALTVGAAVGAGGAVTLTATDTAATTNNVVLNAPVSTTGSTITVTAGDAATINAALTTAAAGTVNVLVDQGAVDAGVGGTVTVATAVTVTGATAVNVTGGADDDTFNLKPFGSTTPTTLTAGAGTDALVLDLTGATTPALALTGVGAGTFTFANRGNVAYTSVESENATNGTFALNLTVATVLAPDANAAPDVTTVAATGAGGTGLTVTLQGNSTGAAQTLFNGKSADVSLLTVTGTTDRDTVNLNLTNLLPAVTVVGDDPTTAPGDTLALNTTNVTGIAFTPGAVGAGSYTFTNRNPVTFTGIETPPVPVVSVAATDASAAETGVTQTANTGTFTLTRIGDLTASLSVPYTLSGTAVGGKDFVTLTGTATFAAGSATATVTVTPLNNSVIDGTRTVTLTLTPAATYALATGLTAATVSIADNDTVSRRVAFGSSTGGAVSVFDNGSPTPTFSFLPYTGYPGGVSVAVGDVNGDGVFDIVTGSTDISSHVKVFDGVTGQLIQSFIAFQGYQAGVSVAAGDLDGDGKAEVIVGTLLNNTTVAAFTFPAAFTPAGVSFVQAAYTGSNGGLTVAAGDLDGDGKAEIITGSRVAPHVKVFDITGKELSSTLVPRLSPTQGIVVGAGDINGDRVAELLVGGTIGTTGVVGVFNGKTPTLVGFLPTGPATPTTLPVPGTADANGDGREDLYVTSGTGVADIFDGTTFTKIGSLTPFVGFKGAVFVG